MRRSDRNRERKIGRKRGVEKKQAEIAQIIIDTIPDDGLWKHLRLTGALESYNQAWMDYTGLSLKEGN